MSCCGFPVSKPEREKYLGIFTRSSFSSSALRSRSRYAIFPFVSALSLFILYSIIRIIQSRKPSAKIVLPALSSLPPADQLESMSSSSSSSFQASVSPSFHFNNVPFLKARRRFFSQLGDLTLLFYQQEPLPPMRGTSFCGLMTSSHPLRVFLYRCVFLLFPPRSHLYSIWILFAVQLLSGF